MVVHCAERRWGRARRRIRSLFKDREHSGVLASFLLMET